MNVARSCSRVCRSMNARNGFTPSDEHRALFDLAVHPRLNRRLVHFFERRRHHEAGQQQRESGDELRRRRALRAERLPQKPEHDEDSREPVIISTSVGSSVSSPIITTMPTVPERRSPPAFSLPTRRSRRGASFVSIVSTLADFGAAIARLLRRTALSTSAAAALRRRLCCAGLLRAALCAAIPTIMCKTARLERAPENVPRTRSACALPLSIDVYTAAVSAAGIDHVGDAAHAAVAHRDRDVRLADLDTAIDWRGPSGRRCTTSSFTRWFAPDANGA